MSIEDKSKIETPPNPLREIVQPFIDLVHASRALWGINLSNLLEGLVYFGWLTLLAIFFNEKLGLNDHQADLLVGFLTGGITLAMFFFGGLVDKWGVRKSMIMALVMMIIGRVILVGATYLFPSGLGLWSSLHIACLVGLLGVILGYGLYQPAIYAGVKAFCDERTSAMGYAMLYALMNLGGFLPGLISPPLRRAFEITGVYWFYVGVTVLNLLLLTVILSKKTQEQAIAAVNAYNVEHGKNEVPKEENKDNIVVDALKKPQGIMEWFKNHPLADPKFSFFIFILIPVQTLFAHNWLTLPQYVDRALGTVGQNYMEFFVNLNPILIFVLTPMVAAVTRKASVYKMMIIGTFVMASPTFLLAIAPSIWLLLAYLVIMSVGEAMWQPRFLQYAAEIAPPGRTGAYMGVAQFPWFLTKILTALYAGLFLMKYCPAVGPVGSAEGVVQNTTTMWFIYGCIAMVSPICLLLAQKWVGKNFKTKFGE